MMHTVNTAIFESFEKHWITSASILVPCPWFPEVAQWAKTDPDADLGVHLASTPIGPTTVGLQFLLNPQVPASLMPMASSR